MRNFTTEDFSGAGQYLVKTSLNPLVVQAGILSTIMYKVGYCLGQGLKEEDLKGASNMVTLVAMSDGMTTLGYFNTLNDPNWQPHMNLKGPANTDKWVWVPFNSVQVFCDWLNNPDFTEEYRFATQEEIIRVVMYQKSRWRN